MDIIMIHFLKMQQYIVQTRYRTFDIFATNEVDCHVHTVDHTSNMSTEHFVLMQNEVAD